MKWRRVWLSQKNGVYVLRWRMVGGREKSKSVGPDKSFALRERAKLEQQINSDPYQDTKPIGLGSFAAEYLKLMAPRVQPSTITVMKHALDGFRAFIGKAVVFHITLKQVEEWFSGRLNSVAPATANKELRTLKAVFNHAIRIGYLKDNLFAKVRPVREDKKALRILTQEEVAKVLEACADKPAWYGMVFTALTSGLRRSEMVFLEWRDVDTEHGLIHVRNKPECHVKSGCEATVPIPKVTIDVLEGLRGRHDRWVFTNRDNTPYRHGLHKRLNVIIKDAGVDRFTFHDLRRTYLSHLQMAGCSEAIAQRLARHASADTTRKYYTAILPATLREAPNRLPWVKGVPKDPATPWSVESAISLGGGF